MEYVSNATHCYDRIILPGRWNVTVDSKVVRIFYPGQAPEFNLRWTEDSDRSGEACLAMRKLTCNHRQGLGETPDNTYIKQSLLQIESQLVGVSKTSAPLPMATPQAYHKPINLHHWTPRPTPPTSHFYQKILCPPNQISHVPSLPADLQKNQNGPAPSFDPS